MKSIYILQKAAVAAFTWSGETGINSHHISTTSHINNNNNNNNTSSNNNNTNQVTTAATPIAGNSPAPPTATTCPSSSIPPIVSSSTLAAMPVGGVQSQNPTQGLVHWMSAVMAEHMTSNSHHDPTVGMHYMWNGGVDVSIPKHSLFQVHISLMGR